MTVATLLLAAMAIQVAARLFCWPSLARLVVRRLDRGGSRSFAGAALALWIAWGLPAIAVLLLLGRGEAAWRTPPEFAAASDLARRTGLGEAQPIAAGLLLGTLLSASLLWWRVRRGKRPFHLGRPPRLPRGPRELPAAGLLALSAGVTEELYFRLALPLAATLVTGSAIAGLALSVAAFGVVHRYQGWIGMAATAFAGLFLSAVYLGSGSLPLAIACHAAIDLNALVIRPWLSFNIARR